MAITFRNLKGTALTHPEMDANLASYYLSSSVSGSTITFYKSGSDGLVVSSSHTLQDLTGSEYTQGLGIDIVDKEVSIQNATNLTNNYLTKWNDGPAELTNSIISTTDTDVFITGGLHLTGSEVNFKIPWPAVGNETHFIELDSYTNEGRTYEYSAFAIENYEGVPDRFNNIFTIYTRDSEDENYGTEITVGPVRTGMFVNPAGSEEYGNVSVQDLLNGRTLTLLYGSEIQIGQYNGDGIGIGNYSSSIETTAATYTVNAPVVEFYSSSKVGSHSDHTHLITGSQYLQNDLHVKGAIHDSLDSPGTDGYVLTSTVSGSVWTLNVDTTGSVNDATITLSASNGITGGGTFTTDQATPDTISFELVPGVVSGSSQIILNDTTGSLLGNRISGPVAEAVNAISSSYAVTASYALNVTDPSWNTLQDIPAGIVSSSTQVDLSQAFGTASHAVSSSYAVTASHALNLKEGIDIVINSGSFNYITATSASFGFIESITGSAKLIGDAFVVVNSNSPTQRYSGLATYDSGSTNVTASFFFDSITNDWNYEYDNSGTVDYGVAMFGPEYTVQGTPVYNTVNTLVKADGGHHLLDSNITDTGTLISLGSNTEVTGTVSASTYYGDGSNLSGIASTDISSLNSKSGSWDTAFGWGDHSIEGYLTSFTETDPIFNAHTASSITSTQISNWDTAFGWGNHASAGYLTSFTETDPIFTASPAAGITGTQITNWDTAFGWGDHSLAGYLTSYSETDTLQTVTTRGSSTSTTITAANFITTSDKRLKSEIKPIQEGLEVIKKFVSYEYIKDGVQDAGFIAQEVQEAIPYTVQEGDKGYLTMNDRPVLAHMHKAILEIEARLSAIEEKLK